MTGLCTACGGRTAEAVKWIDGKPYHPECEPPLTLIDALAVLAASRGARASEKANDAMRQARQIVDSHAKNWTE